MRVINQSAQIKQQELLQIALREKGAAIKEEMGIREKIKSDRDLLKSSVDRLKAETGEMEKRKQTMEKRLMELTEKETGLTKKLGEMSSEIRELAGYVRSNAKDIESLLNQSHQSAFSSNRTGILKEIGSENKFPDMADIEQMTALLFNEIRLSGDVRVEKQPVVDRNGSESDADVLVLGNFTAAYRHEEEVGFLLYSEAGRRFFALSKLPPAGIRSQIAAYMAGESDDAPIDISHGAALRQLTHRLNIIGQIPKGGPIVYPILAVGFFALLLIVERILFISRKSTDADGLMQALEGHLIAGKWQDASDLCRKWIKKPLARVLLSGLNQRNSDRPDLENTMQEAILSELPGLERFLSTLGMIASVSPLLGLLGTVSGMISTFHVITYYGTSDPKLMSGGISEALVCTMLGLAVAIPTMFCYSFLTQKSENLVAQMEEKGIALVNIICKIREPK